MRSGSRFLLFFLGLCIQFGLLFRHSAISSPSFISQLDEGCYLVHSFQISKTDRSRSDSSSEEKERKKTKHLFFSEGNEGVFLWIVTCRDSFQVYGTAYASSWFST